MKAAVRRAMLEEKRKNEKFAVVKADKLRAEQRRREQEEAAPSAQRQHKKRGGGLFGGIVRKFRPGGNDDNNDDDYGRNTRGEGLDSVDGGSRRLNSAVSVDESGISTMDSRNSERSGRKHVFGRRGQRGGDEGGESSPTKGPRKELKKEDSRGKGRRRGSNGSESLMDRSGSVRSRNRHSDRRENERQQQRNNISNRKDGDAVSLGQTRRSRSSRMKRSTASNASNASITDLPPRRIEVRSGSIASIGSLQDNSMGNGENNKRNKQRNSSSSSIGRVRRVDRSSLNNTSSSVGGRERRRNRSSTASLGASMKLQEGTRKPLTKEERQNRRAHLRQSASQVVMNTSLNLGHQGDYENDDVLGGDNNDVIGQEDVSNEGELEHDGIIGNASSRNYNSDNYFVNTSKSNIHEVIAEDGDVPMEIEVASDIMNNSHPLFSGSKTRRTSFRDMSPSISRKTMRHASIGIPNSKINSGIAERRAKQQQQQHHQ